MLSAEEKLAGLVDAAVGRELELHHYQVNIDNYTAMLAALPTGEWPDKFQAYKNLTSVDNLPVAMSDADVTAIGDLIFRDRLALLLRTEKAEQRKSAAVRDALKAQIGVDYDTKVAERRAAMIAAA